MPDPKQPDPEQITGALEEADDAVDGSFGPVTGVVATAAKIRLEFFDRIVLLDGGTITLSVTLLGFLASKNAHVPLRSPKLLIASWISFVVSMLVALARNWVEQNRLVEAENINAFWRAWKPIVKFSNTLAAPEIVDRNLALLKGVYAKEKSLRRWTNFAGIASVIAMLGGFILLLMFAATNVFTN